MVKTVVESRQVSHLWANQSQEHARNSGRSVWFEGKTLYSYQEPIAYIMPSGIVVMTDDRFSVTTSKHVSLAWRALKHREGVILLPSLKTAIAAKSELLAGEYVQFCNDRVKEFDASAAKRRSEYLRANDMASAAKFRKAAQFVWNDIAGLKGDCFAKAEKVTAKARKAACNQIRANYVAAASIDLETHLTVCGARGYSEKQVLAFTERQFALSALPGNAAKLMGKAFVKECESLLARAMVTLDAIHARQKALRDLELIESAEKVAAWQRGEAVNLPHGLPVMCRVKGAEVQTSLGARVPLDQALSLAGIAGRCRAEERALDLKGKRIGQFMGGKIASNGDLTVGCHFIPWQSIQAAMDEHVRKGG
jgi:hypothetical protein